MIMDDRLPPELKGKKASVVFMEYVEPFLNTLVLDRAEQGVEQDFTIEELEAILRVPWCIWNAIIAEKDPLQKIDFLAWMDSLLKHIPTSIRSLLNFMKSRKRSAFGQYQYYLGDYKVYHGEDGDLRIRVESRLPPSP